MNEKILEVLRKVIYPNFKKSVVELNFVKAADIADNGIAVVALEIPAANGSETSNKLREDIESALKNAGFENTRIDLKQPDKKEAPKPQNKNLAPQIKHFVMVSSGKGGVGKSTTSVNLAIAFAMQGKKVGLLDADIYGPNIPRMMGLAGNSPRVDESGKRLIPLQKYGVEMISMGILYEEGQSLIWRGPMVMRACEQMLSDVVWSELDVLVIDMPPGTGDAQLTLAQSVPLSAGVVVSTPQNVALDDGARSLDMFVKLKVPLAGIIENMSGFICPKCGEEFDIFGRGGTKNLAEKYNTKILAQVPLEPSLRKAGDEGRPQVYFAPDSKSAKEYLKAAKEIWDFLEELGERSNAEIQPVKS